MTSAKNSMILSYDCILGVTISFLNSWEFLDIYSGDLCPISGKG